MKLNSKFLIFLVILIVMFVILFEIDFDGDISVRLWVDIKPKQIRNKIKNICPKSPIAKADALGRLGNQISTYVNHIAMQWEYGYSLYLSDKISTNMRNLLHNVTFPATSPMLDNCNISFWPRAADWVSFTRFLKTEKNNCRTKNGGVTFERNSFLESCLNKSEEKTQHINIKSGHNKPDWDLLQPYIADLRRYHLHMNIELQTKIGSILEQQRELSERKNPIFVGVHIRRGDFGGYTRFGYKMIDETYYLSGMEYYRKKHPGNCVFLLVSDDMSWCREKFGDSDVSFIGGSSPEEDLALISSCNHALIGYGTFGLWGGFIAGGEVVLPETIGLYQGTASETAASVWNWTLLPGF